MVVYGVTDKLGALSDIRAFMIAIRRLSKWLGQNGCPYVTDEVLSLSGYLGFTLWRRAF